MKRSTISEKNLKVSEIFYSLQGEGPWIGIPCVFIRLAGCREPYCPFCDTPYALTGGIETAVREILNRTESYPTKKAVITGGEPFIQWETGLSDLHEGLLSRGYQVQYETSGKVKIPDTGRAMVVCSPKFIGGTWFFEHENIDSVDYFKFVAADHEWLRAIDRFVTYHGIETVRVFLMPLGSTRKDQLANMRRVFESCLRKGYRMTPRLHVLTYDTVRGV